MSDSVEYACESHLIGLLVPQQVTGGPLDGIPSRHFERTDAAILDALTFKGERGEKQLEGLKCWVMTVTITFASGTKNPTESDAIASAVADAIYNPAKWPTGLVFPGYGTIEPGAETRREDGNKVRKRIITIPMLANTGPIPS